MAQLIFQCYDVAAERAISVETLQALLRTLLEVSLKTGNLVVDHQTSRSNEAKALHYVQKLRSYVSQAVNTLTKSFSVNDQGLVSEEAFVEAFFHLHLGTSEGCRAALLTQTLTSQGKLEPIP